MSDADDGAALRADLLDLVEYMRAFSAEEKRCQRLDGNAVAPTQLFDSLRKRIETVWGAVEQRVQAFGLPATINGVREGERLIGYDIVLSFRPDKPSESKTET